MELRIPKSRIAVLIGVKGKTRYIIERKTKTKLKVSSREGIVEIDGDDPFNVYNTEKIIKSIGRGFNPEVALMLVDEDNCFELIDMTMFSGKSKIKLSRMKSRLIGTNGKGKIENVQIARIAVQDILNGAPHGPVYKTLEERMHSLQK
ncbi:hypothetical protein HYT56_05070 [Candidatus Woesearchaeota archaeon]|nr:hypothetical protein [Candidatus Woesearchaeota archaeon]